VPHAPACNHRGAGRDFGRRLGTRGTPATIAVALTRAVADDNDITGDVAVIVTKRRSLAGPGRVSGG